VSPAQRLRELLAQPNVEIMPGCYDALSAKLVADAGYKVTFMSGFAVSAARLGLPDTGLISFAEMLDSLRNCCAASGNVPLIGDGDTGYGNALNVQRTVVEYARAGAAAVMIEDQISPKKCGHTRGKQVVSRAEARMKIRAAVDARANADILIMARTDARAVYGFDEALARCRDFEAEGADIIFLEAPETDDEMRRFCGAMTKPCMANMVPGGKSPILPPAQLQEAGYKLALYPVMLLSSAITAMQNALAALRPGSTTAQPPAISFTDLQGVVGFSDYWSRETRYQVKE
jgi:2-methylisocitrate lyase-like PEP mutase family enzyme